MRKRTRWLLVIAAVVFAAIAVLMLLFAIGKGLAAPVSNCNRDCDDGTANGYAALVFGGLAVVSTLVAALAPPPKS